MDRISNEKVLHKKNFKYRMSDKKTAETLIRIFRARHERRPTSNHTINNTRY